MKQFFKFMFASMLGFFLSLLLILIIFSAIIGILVATISKDSVVISEKTVLHLKLNLPIEDRSSKDPFSMFGPDGFGQGKPVGLNDYLKQIKRASCDDNISGILLELTAIPASYSTIEELRQALNAFSDSGKFILSYGDVYDQKAYYLATTADSIFINPEGMFIFQGIQAQGTFFKGMLSKIGIEAQYSRRGKYKSAIETFTADSMSPANEEQITAVVFDYWNMLLASISESRGISADLLNLYADSLKALEPEVALELGFFDRTLYYDQLLDGIKGRLGVEEKEKLQLVEIGKYMKAPESKHDKTVAKDKIAVIYAQGSIQGGKGDDGTIGSERFAEAIRKARENDKVKAIVLRVNSPGGDALASEIIYRELMLAREKKPVVASFGGVAASGGYYIACGADTIVAMPNTLTGSIGIFWMIPNLEGLLTGKMGITFDEVKTNSNAGFPTVNGRMSDYEYKVLDDMIGNTYKTFLSHVAEGRSITVDQADSLGQGRIWSGEDAMNVGLVDVMGGLDKAIAIAAEMAGLEKYSLMSLPTQKDPFEQIMEGFQAKAGSKALRAELGEYYRYYEMLRETSKMQGIQARMPYYLDIR